MWRRIGPAFTLPAPCASKGEQTQLRQPTRVEIPPHKHVWRHQVSWFHLCRSFDFPLLLNKRENNIFRDNLSAGTVVWAVRLVLYKPGVVLFVELALMCAPGLSVFRCRVCALTDLILRMNLFVSTSHPITSPSLSMFSFILCTTFLFLFPPYKWFHYWCRFSETSTYLLIYRWFIKFYFFSWLLIYNVWSSGLNLSILCVSRAAVWYHIW